MCGVFLDEKGRICLDLEEYDTQDYLEEPGNICINEDLISEVFTDESYKERDEEVDRILNITTQPNGTEVKDMVPTTAEKCDHPTGYYKHEAPEALEIVLNRKQKRNKIKNRKYKGRQRRLLAGSGKESTPQAVDFPGADVAQTHPSSSSTDAAVVNVAGESDVPPPPEPLQDDDKKRMRSKAHLANHKPFIKGCPGCMAKSRDKKHFKDHFKFDDEKYKNSITMDQVTIKDF